MIKYLHGGTYDINTKKSRHKHAHNLLSQWTIDRSYDKMALIS